MRRRGGAARRAEGLWSSVATGLPTEFVMPQRFRNRLTKPQQEPYQVGRSSMEIWLVDVTRPFRYSINVTLDVCCDHRAILADEGR